MRSYARRLGCIAICWWIVTGAAVSTAADKHTGNNQETLVQEVLVWSDEFNGAASQAAPDPRNWTYDTGGNGWGNNELETYCAFGSAASPCDPKNPNAYVGNDGYLHIVARKSASGAYTSARMKSVGLRSFKYGRIEARIKMPQGQGLWPAFWTLGDNIATVEWPACGEMDIMESVGKIPSTNYGSIHGTGFTGTSIGTPYTLANNTRFGDAFHTFGILWTPGKIQFYVDSPTNVYATYTPSSLPQGAVWPFDSGKVFFILNLAVGGSWPGSPDATTVFPNEMLVDYVRVYAEPQSSPTAAKSAIKQ